MAQQNINEPLFLKWKRLQTPKLMTPWCVEMLVHMVAAGKVDRSFDPWSQEFEKLKPLARRYFTKPIVTPRGTLPPQVVGIHDSRYLQAVVASEVGHNQALIEQEPAYGLYALMLLVRSGISVPEWVQRATFQPIQEIAQQRAASIDAAFGRQKSKVTPSKLGSARQNLDDALQLHFVLSWMLMDGSQPLDTLILEDAGERANLKWSKSKLWELHRLGKEALGFPDLADVRSVGHPRSTPRKR